MFWIQHRVVEVMWRCPRAMVALPLSFFVLLSFVYFFYFILCKIRKKKHKETPHTHQTLQTSPCLVCFIKKADRTRTLLTSQGYQLQIPFRDTTETLPRYTNMQALFPSVTQALALIVKFSQTHRYLLETWGAEWTVEMGKADQAVVERREKVSLSSRCSFLLHGCR